MIYLDGPTSLRLHVELILIGKRQARETMKTLKYPVSCPVRVQFKIAGYG